MTQGPEDLKGWIALYRQLMAHWLWPKGRYSQLEAWLYMLFKTNYERKWWAAGKTWVERGELILSETKAATEWDWTRKEVRCFWEKLKREQMIEWLPEKKRFTKIRIVNYDKYQIQPEELRNILKGDKRGDKSGYKVNPELTRLEGVQGDNPGDKRGDITKQYNNINKKDLYCAVVNYLNEKAGTSYKPTTKATQQLINGRLAEGFTLDDFKRVIDIKAAQWKDDPKMRPYLRPQTLFSTKFEGYLNEQPTESKQVRTVYE